MIIYNVTIKVEASIAADWLMWMKQEHIPDVMGTGCFSSFKIVRLLEIDDSEGPTYAIQYYAESKDNYNRYIQTHAVKLRDKSFARWGERFMAFRSVMQEVV
jgi:hypothetical protein